MVTARVKEGENGGDGLMSTESTLGEDEKVLHSSVNILDNSKKKNGWSKRGLRPVRVAYLFCAFSK